MTYNNCKPAPPPPSLTSMNSYGVISSTYNAPSGATVGQLATIITSDTVGLATSNGVFPAIGFIASMPSTSQAILQYDGEINGFTGLIAGETYFLGPTPGGVTSTPTLSPGFIVQQVGIAKDSATMIIKIDINYTLL